MTEARALMMLLQEQDVQLAWIKQQGVDDPFLEQRVAYGDDVYATLVRYITWIGLGRKDKIDRCVRTQWDMLEQSRIARQQWWYEKEARETAFAIERDEIRVMRPPLGVDPQQSDEIECPNCRFQVEVWQNFLMDGPEAYHLSCVGCDRVYRIDADGCIFDMTMSWAER